MQVLDASVHALVRNREPLEDQPPLWEVIGSAFCISRDPNPTFLTCAHVVALAPEHHYDRLALTVLAPGGAAAGVSIRVLFPELDIALLESSPEGLAAEPAPIWNGPPPEIGLSVGALGFPLPEAPKLSPTGGSLDIHERLATGHLSGLTAIGEMKEWRFAKPTLTHLESTFHSYGGMSGGPLFTTEGHVIGVCRGGRRYADGIASFSLAVPMPDILATLATIPFPPQLRQALP